MAYRDSTTASGNTSTPTVAVPAGVEIGDIVHLVISIDSAPVDFTGKFPANFTILHDVDVTADTQSTAVGWKRLTAQDSGSYVLDDLAVNFDWVIQAYAHSGRHASDPPVGATPNIQNTAQASPVTVTANGVTAVEGDDLLWISAPDPTVEIGTKTHAPPSTFTEREDAHNVWAVLSGATKDAVSAGATGSISGTLTMSDGNAGWAAFLIRIPAAPSDEGGYRLLADGNGRRITADGLHNRILGGTTSVDTLPAGHSKSGQNPLIRQ